MDNTKEVFLKLVKDYGLDFSDCIDNIEHRTHFYAKLPGYAGFLIDSYWDNEKCIRVATCVENYSDTPFFWGNDAYYEESKVREQVQKMIKLAKENSVEKKIDKMNTDFK